MGNVNKICHDEKDLSSYLSKGLITSFMVALVGFLSGVDPKMFLERAVLGERLSTALEMTNNINFLKKVKCTSIRAFSVLMTMSHVGGIQSLSRSSPKLFFKFF